MSDKKAISYLENEFSAAGKDVDFSVDVAKNIRALSRVLGIALALSLPAIGLMQSDATPDVVGEITNGVPGNQFGDLIEELTRQIGDVDNRVGAVDNRVGAVDDRVSDVDNRISALDNRISTSDNRVSALDTRVSLVDNRVGAVDQRVDAFENRISAIDNRVSAVDGRVTTLVSAVDDRITLHGHGGSGAGNAATGNTQIVMLQFQDKEDEIFQVQLPPKAWFRVELRQGDRFWALPDASFTLFAEKLTFFELDACSEENIEEREFNGCNLESMLLSLEQRRPITNEILDSVIVEGISDLKAEDPPCHWDKDIREMRCNLPLSEVSEDTDNLLCIWLRHSRDFEYRPESAAIDVKWEPGPCPDR